MSKNRILRIAGRVVAFVLFSCLLFVFVMSLVYGLKHYISTHPYSIGIPLGVVVACVVIAFISFYFLTRKELRDETKSDGRAQTNHAKSNHIKEEVE